MSATRSFCLAIGMGLAVLAARVPDAAAQPPQTPPPTIVRVTRDSVIIWRPGFATVATVVKAGTELRAISRQDDFYEVLLPASGAVSSDVGLIAVSQVELVSGPPPPERPATQPRPGSARAVEPSRRKPQQSGVRAFGQIAYGWFAADKTFKAITGQPGGAWFGGGGEVHFKSGLFVQGSVQRLQRTGERAVVSANEVFKLGIADTITITPIEFTVGYRLPGARTVSYFGGGAGQYRYKEKFEFADPNENIDEHFTSYHGLVGVEWRYNGWLANAFEVQFTHVPNAVKSGIAMTYGESNLGGVDLRFKILIGR